jgi:hypothetical protein
MLNFLKKIAVPLLLFLLFLLLTLSAVSESRVFDEITHVNAGIGFVVNKDFRLDPFNPPLARELLAIPAIINKTVVKDPTLFWPRMVSILFTVLLGIVVYIFAKKLYGKAAGIIALFIFTLEPNILTNGHYAQTDIIFTFFYILSIFVYYLWRKKFTTEKMIVFGLLTGLLLSTKTTALPFLFLPLSILIIYDYGLKKIFNKKLFKINLVKACLFLVTAALILWATYFFKSEPMLGLRFDPNRPAIKIAKTNNFIKFALYQPLPLGSYISTIKQQLVFNYSGLYRRDSMVLGNVSHNGQSGLYFLPLIILKIPIELTLLFFLTLFLFKRKIKDSLIVLVPFFSILLLALLTNAVIVLRYILPIIPLLIIYSGQIVNFKHKFKKIFIAVFLILLMMESFSAFPHYISYLNLALGGDSTGYKYVFDANYDWGQGLIDLKKYQDKNHVARLNLAYFGDIKPSLFGIKYNQIFDSVTNYNYYDLSKIKIEKNSVYAISTTCWYLCGYYKLPAFKAQKIKDVVGGSILIFNF